MQICHRTAADSIKMRLTVNKYQSLIVKFDIHFLKIKLKIFVLFCFVESFRRLFFVETVVVLHLVLRSWRERSERKICQNDQFDFEERLFSCLCCCIQSCNTDRYQADRPGGCTEGSKDTDPTGPRSPHQLHTCQPSPIRHPLTETTRQRWHRK